MSLIRRYSCATVICMYVQDGFRSLRCSVTESHLIAPYSINIWGAFTACLHQRILSKKQPMVRENARFSARGSLGAFSSKDSWIRSGCSASPPPPLPPYTITTQSLFLAILEYILVEDVLHFSEVYLEVFFRVR